MRTVVLNDPILVEGATVTSITVHDPNERQRQTMRKSRRSPVGFDYRSTISAACRLTALGEISLHALSAVDYAQLSFAIEEAFQSAVGRDAFYRDMIARETGNA